MKLLVVIGLLLSFLGIVNMNQIDSMPEEMSHEFRGGFGGHRFGGGRFGGGRFGGGRFGGSRFGGHRFGGGRFGGGRFSRGRFHWSILKCNNLGYVYLSYLTILPIFSEYRIILWLLLALSEQHNVLSLLEWSLCELKWE